MSLELTPQGTDVPTSGLSSSLADGTLGILLAHQVLSFIKLSLRLVQLGGLLLQLTLHLRCPEDNTSSVASPKKKQHREKGAFSFKLPLHFVTASADNEMHAESGV